MGPERSDFSKLSGIAHATGPEWFETHYLRPDYSKCCLRLTSLASPRRLLDMIISGHFVDLLNQNLNLNKRD